MTLPINTITKGNCLEVLPTWPAASTDSCVTSPPYWQQREYHDVPETDWPHMDYRPMVGAPLIEIAAMRCVHGNEPDIGSYIGHEVAVFREVYRVLADHGTLFLNLGDTYTGGGRGGGAQGPKQRTHRGSMLNAGPRIPGMADKNLLGVPWRVALALQADGWVLRRDIIWCLSGGTWVYARTQKGDMPMMVRDLRRLDPRTVRLWNGNKWTQLQGMSRSKRTGTEIELVLRSGERISCTPTHRFPTSRGIMEAGNLRVGDKLLSCQLPEPDALRDTIEVGSDAAWFAGLYIAEGSRSQGKISIAGHAKEMERWDRVKRIAHAYGGSATCTIKGNNQTIRVYGKLLNAIIDQFVSGRTAHDKCFAPTVWQYSDTFVRSLLTGYLAGDGHWEEENRRWRLGFCRNYNLERDIRTACARLGYHLILNLSSVPYKGKRVPTFRGEIRRDRSGHHNEKDRNEIVAIHKARCREVYDLGVADAPHVFALASGVLTHNSKPSPMPESGGRAFITYWVDKGKNRAKCPRCEGKGCVGDPLCWLGWRMKWAGLDRCAVAHEYLFHFAKTEAAFFDIEAIKEPQAESTLRKHSRIRPTNPKAVEATRGEERANSAYETTSVDVGGRQKRDVWTIASEAVKEKHFAAFPCKLVEPCILAGCPQEVCRVCGKPRVRVVETVRKPTRLGLNTKVSTRVPAGWDTGPGSHNKKIGRYQDKRMGNRDPERHTTERTTLGWTDCGHGGDYRKGIVLDPFAGTGRVGVVATHLGRGYVLIELSETYIETIADVYLTAAATSVTVEEIHNGQGILFGGEQ